MTLTCKWFTIDSGTPDGPTVAELQRENAILREKIAKLESRLEDQ